MQAKVGEHGETDEGHQPEAEGERSQSVRDPTPDDRARERDGQGHAALLPAEAALHADHPHDRLL